MAGIRIVAMLAIVVLLSGCSRWAIDRFDSETATRIDAQLQVGMSYADFQAAFPDAQSMDAEGADSYLVSVQETCFWCHSGSGFRRSSDFYARVVSFENGSLTSIEPVSEARP